MLGRGSVVDFYFTDVAHPHVARRLGVRPAATPRARLPACSSAGLYNAPVHRYHVSLAHTEIDIAMTLDAHRTGADRMSDVRQTLPATYYTDRSHFRARAGAVLRRHVGAVSRAVEDLAAPGDYVLRDIAGESVIVTRDGNGGFRGFYNVCRHRGTRLCTDAKGHFTERIQCPYHAWTYGLDGRLVSAPHMDGTPGFCKDDIALSAVARGRVGRSSCS